MRIRLWVCLVVVLVGQSVWGQVKMPSETRNAALRYWQAFAELKDPPASAETKVAMAKILNLGAGWDEAALGGIVAENETALGIMHRATKLPECDWGLEYSQGPKASAAFFPRAHVLAQLNTLGGIREFHQGRMQDAVDTWVAGIRFGQDVANGGSLVFALTAKGILLQEMKIMIAQAKQGRFSAAQKKQLVAAVSALPEDGFDWGLAWEMDEAGSDVFFAELQHSQKPASFFESLMGEVAPKDCMPPKAEEMKLYREYMGDVANALRSPPPAAKQRLIDMGGKAEAICETLRKTIPNADRVNDARVEMIATRKELLNLLAAR
jgi:hypothetical protein